MLALQRGGESEVSVNRRTLEPVQYLGYSLDTSKIASIANIFLFTELHWLKILA